MVSVFLRLIDVRYENVDMFPDFLAALFMLAAIFILRRRKDSFKRAYLPAAIYLITSFLTLYNFLPKEQNAGLAGLYAAGCVLLLVFDCAAYKRCFESFNETYQSESRGGFAAVAAYAVCRVVGIIVSVWIYMLPEETVASTAVFIAWAAVNTVV